MTSSGSIIIPVGTIARAPIHFHNFNISGIYRLGDLISPRICITWFLSDISLWHSVKRGALGLQKDHLLAFLEKWTVREEEKLTIRKCITGLCHIECWPLIFVNWLWLCLIPSSHGANYLTFRRPFTYPAVWKKKYECDRQDGGWGLLLYWTWGDSECRKQTEQTAWAGQMCERFPGSVFSRLTGRIVDREVKGQWKCIFESLIRPAAWLLLFFYFREQ